MGVDFEAYQDAAARTINGSLDIADQIKSATLGLVGESGELAEHYKKYFYHGHPHDVGLVVKEAGDVLWYLAAICTAEGISLNDIAQANIDKLWQRYPNGFNTHDSIKREDVNGR